MKKGNVFIAWSGDDFLASAVKKELGDRGYQGIVGGKRENIINPTVNATIIEQMKKCSSAIMLFTRRQTVRNRTKFDFLSNNMVFEFGYLLGTLKFKRILLVYIGVKKSVIPSDLTGVWAQVVDDVVLDEENLHDQMFNDNLAKKIVDYYLENQLFIEQYDKLDLISENEKLRYMIEQHKDSPVYYHYEMAQFILLYGHSAYIYDNVESARQLLESVRTVYKSQEVLNSAISLCIKYFELLDNLSDSGKGRMLSLPKRIYEAFKRSVLGLITKVSDMTEVPESFRFLFLAMAYEYLTFANMMRYGDEVPNDGLFLFREECCERCLEYCGKLTVLDEEHNGNFVRLFQAYVTRNKALLYRNMKRAGYDGLFEESIRLRKELDQHYKGLETFNRHFINNISLEYYLALSDNLEEKSGKEKTERLEALGEYLEYVNSNTFNRLYHIGTIESKIRECNSGRGGEDK